MYPIRIGVCLLLVLGGLSVARGQGYEETRDVVYAERDGEKMLADVRVPRGTGPFPGVLVVHGGAWRSGSKTQLARVAQHLADEGFTTVAINYRLAPVHKYPAQIEDVRAAVRWMRSEAQKYQIDPDRIGAWGYSAGGHLAAMLAVGSTPKEQAEKLAPQERIEAAVCGGAPCNFQTLPGSSRALKYWLDATPSENPDVYRDASPISRVSDKTPPIFFFHGDRDGLVQPRQPKEMAAALEKAGVEVKLYMVPRATHLAAALSRTAVTEGTEFLKRHLQKAE